ncbi:unnamed protein product, partial [Closterium sp. Naga37s-1]
MMCLVFPSASPFYLSPRLTRLSDLQQRMRKKVYRRRMVKRVMFAVVPHLHIALSSYALIRPAKIRAPASLLAIHPPSLFSVLPHLHIVLSSYALIRPAKPRASSPPCAMLPLSCGDSSGVSGHGGSAARPILEAPQKYPPLCACMHPCLTVFAHMCALCCAHTHTHTQVETALVCQDTGAILHGPLPRYQPMPGGSRIIMAKAEVDQVKAVWATTYFAFSSSCVSLARSFPARSRIIMAKAEVDQVKAVWATTYFAFSSSCVSLARSFLARSRIIMAKAEVDQVKAVWATTYFAFSSSCVSLARSFPARSRIIMAKAEVDQVKAVSPHDLLLLGFKPLHCLKDYHNLQPPTFLFPDEETLSGSTAAFIALHNAMLDANSFALACWAKIGLPRLVAILPQQEKVDEGGTQVQPAGWHMIPLPFYDDIRPAEKYARWVPGQGARDAGGDGEEGGSGGEVVSAPRADAGQVATATALMRYMHLKSFSPLDILNPGRIPFTPFPHFLVLPCSSTGSEAWACSAVHRLRLEAIALDLPEVEPVVDTFQILDLSHPSEPSLFHLSPLPHHPDALLHARGHSPRPARGAARGGYHPARGAARGGYHPARGAACGGYHPARGAACGGYHLPEVQPVVDTTLPEVQPVVDTTLPEVQPVVDTTLPEVQPVVDTTLPEVQPVVDTTLPEVQPVVDTTLPEVQPVVDTTLPEVQPVVDTTLPEVQPVVDTTLPEVQPVVDTTLPDSSGPSLAPHSCLIFASPPPSLPTAVIQMHYSMLEAIALDLPEVQPVVDTTLPDYTIFHAPPSDGNQPQKKGKAARATAALRHFKDAVYGSGHDEEEAQRGAAAQAKADAAERKRKATFDAATAKAGVVDWRGLAEKGKGGKPLPPASQCFPWPPHHFSARLTPHGASSPGGSSAVPHARGNTPTCYGTAGSPLPFARVLELMARRRRARSGGRHGSRPGGGRTPVNSQRRHVSGWKQHSLDREGPGESSNGKDGSSREKYPGSTITDTSTVRADFSKRLEECLKQEAIQGSTDRQALVSGAGKGRGEAGGADRAEAQARAVQAEGVAGRPEDLAQRARLAEAQVDMAELQAQVVCAELQWIRSAVERQEAGVAAVLAELAGLRQRVHRAGEGMNGGGGAQGSGEGGMREVQQVEAAVASAEARLWRVEAAAADARASLIALGGEAGEMGGLAGIDSREGGNIGGLCGDCWSEAGLGTQRVEGMVGMGIGCGGEVCGGMRGCAGLEGYGVGEVGLSAAEFAVELQRRLEEVQKELVAKGQGHRVVEEKEGRGGVEGGAGGISQPVEGEGEQSRVQGTELLRGLGQATGGGIVTDGVTVCEKACEEGTRESKHGTDGETLLGKQPGSEDVRRDGELVRLEGEESSGAGELRFWDRIGGESKLLAGGSVNGGVTRAAAGSAIAKDFHRK